MNASRGIFTKLSISAASTDCPFRSSCARPRAIPRDGLFFRSFLSQVSARNTEWAAARCGNTKVCLLIPAYVSIKVNCEGWTTEDIGDYLKSFGLDQQEYIDVIYEYSIDMPLYFFNYAMGYVYTNKIYESVNHRSDGDKTAFFKRYLNMGPCMFDILFEEFGTEE